MFVHWIQSTQLTMAECEVRSSLQAKELHALWNEKCVDATLELTGY